MKYVVVLLCWLSVSHASTTPSMRVDRVIHDLNIFITLLEEYRSATGSFPNEGQGLDALVQEKLLQDLPADSWGREYLYSSSGQTYTVWSLGKNGAMGGDGLDFDFSTSSLQENKKHLELVKSGQQKQKVIQLLPTLVLFCIFLLVYVLVRKYVRSRQFRQ